MSILCNPWRGTARRLSSTLAASTLALLLTPVAGCVGNEGVDAVREEGEVGTASFASTFDCDGSFGTIGEAILLTGEIRIGGKWESVTTVPLSNSWPIIECNGPYTTINWESIHFKVPAGTLPSGTVILEDFVIWGNPLANQPGSPVAATACFPDYDPPVDGYADPTDLVWFTHTQCTLADLANGACGLKSAIVNYCVNL